MRHTWTKQETKFLIDNYSENGLKFCANALNLPETVVFDKKSRLKLKLKINIINEQLGPEGKRCCSVCSEIKVLEEFAKDGTRRRYDCKICNAKQVKEYQSRHPEETAKRSKMWYKNNKDKVIAYREKRREITRRQSRHRYKTDKVCREKRLQSRRNYYHNPLNRDKIRAANRKRLKRYVLNPMFRVIRSLRRRLLFVLEGKRKAAHSMELIGCTREQLRSHLESKFKPGMSWENYGVHGWHIDHIKPCASFDLSDPAQQHTCFHYSNLQPLWAYENLQKGDKLPDGSSSLNEQIGI